MTKREICERLMNIRDSAMFASDGSGDIGGGSPCYNIGSDLFRLILDLAAPETEGEKEAAFRERCRAVFGDLAVPEEKEPPVLVYEEKGEKVPCPVCGEPAAPIKNKPGEVYCKQCGVSFRLKRREEGK